MKKTFHYVLAIFTCLLFVGCVQTSNEDDGERATMNADEVFDFKFINRAPKTTEEKPISDVIKIFFHETSFDEPYEAVAIDLENGEVYGNPSLSIRGVTGDVVVDSDHVDDVYDILKKYDVSTWETEYIVGDPDEYEDGYSWRLMMQFKDGTVKTYKGNDEEIKPDNFDEFSRKLHEFSGSELD